MFGLIICGLWALFSVTKMGCTSIENKPVVSGLFHINTCTYLKKFWTIPYLQVLVGHPDYEVTGGSVVFKGENLLDMAPEERSHAGLFMSFQTPVEIPGVSNDAFLLMSYNARRAKQGLKELDPIQVYISFWSNFCDWCIVLSQYPFIILPLFG